MLLEHCTQKEHLSLSSVWGPSSICNRTRQQYQSKHALLSERTCLTAHWRQLEALSHTKQLGTHISSMNALIHATPAAAYPFLCSRNCNSIYASTCRLCELIFLKTLNDFILESPEQLAGAPSPMCMYHMMNPPHPCLVSTQPGAMES